MKLNNNLVNYGIVCLFIATISTPLLADETKQQEDTGLNSGKEKDQEAVDLQSIFSTGLESDSFELSDILETDKVEFFDSNLLESEDRVAGTSFKSLEYRGFNGGYNTNYIDGNPVWSIEDRKDRVMRFDVFPALFKKAETSKLARADLNANSIGAYVNARSLRAFDGGNKSYFKSSLQGGYFEQTGKPESTNLPYTFEGIGKFTFGTSNNLGVVYGFNLKQEEQFEESTRVKDGYEFANGIGGFVDTPERQILETASIYQTENERQNIFAKLEARSKDKFYSFLSLNYFHEQEEATANETGLFLESVDRIPATLEPGKGTYSIGKSSAEFSEVDYERNIFFAGSGLDFIIDEDEYFKVRTSITELYLDTEFERAEPFTDTNDITFPTYDATGDELEITASSIPSGTGTFNHTDGNFLENKATFSSSEDIHDRHINFNLDYSNNADPDSKGLGFKTGAGWQRLDRTMTTVVRQYVLPAGTGYSLQDNNPGLGSASAFSPIFIDRNAYWDFITTNGILLDGTFGISYELVEDIFSGYGMATYKKDKLQLNAGFRVEHTDFSLDSDEITTNPNTTTTNIPDTVARISQENQYTNLLPSINLSYQLQKQTSLFAAYGRTLARPDFESFTEGTQTFFSSSSRNTIKISDPFLDPRLSDNFDVGMTHLFGKINTQVGFGLFYKYIQNEIFEQISESTIGGELTSTERRSGDSDAWVMGFDGSIIVKRFDFLPGPFDNFGLNTRFTYTHSEWDITNGDGSTRTILGLRDQPEFSTDVKLTYNNRQKYGGQLRYKFSWRTFTGDFGDTAQNDIWVDNYGQLDASAWYQAFDSVQVYVLGKNLNDPVYTEVSGSTGDLLSRSFRGGRSFFLGFKIKF